jgi:NADPH:quinone reductase-like Zn-dependent oxidoreductase
VEPRKALSANAQQSAITAQVARTFPLAEAAAALRYAESGGVAGKVVIVP